jgi:D-aminopeptidase
VLQIEALADAYIDPLFYGAIEATEEAVVNALVAAETMTGRDGVTAYALDPERLLGALRRAGTG